MPDAGRSSARRQRQFDRAQQRATTVARAWYVVPCLSADTLAPASGTYALSSWPLADRLVTPFATRLWTVQAAANVAQALIKTRNSAAHSDDAERFSSLLGLLSRGSNWATAGGAFAPADGGRDAVSTAVEAIAARAADDARRLSDQHQLVVAPAVERVEALALRHPRVALWGNDLTVTSSSTDRRVGA